MQIAIYGKGGIGKSTVSANLSAALARCDNKVMQIGCDPKHDSTRLLHHGQKVQTVLDYLLDTPPDEQKIENVLMHGYLGTGCVEAGGPRPGMGCAGRGILTSFDFLNKFNALSGYDYIIYDVLGDVVCGGFAVPVRKQYANMVFLVTSGESMSIYAANNILRGIKNLDPEENRIAGIIYNSRGVGDETQRVLDFAEAVALPVCARIPRSDAFAKAEMQAVTVMESEPESREAEIFILLAQQLANGIELHDANPLDEEQMELFMRGGTLQSIYVNPKRKSLVPNPILLPERPTSIPLSPQKRALSDPFSRIPLYGCAYRGAVDLAVHVKDAAVLCHAPKSCTWFAINGITAYARRGLYERGILYPAFIPRYFENTDITMQDAVFGGVEHAREKALALVKQGMKAIIVVTACIPGLSGDDLSPVKKEVNALGCNMYIVHTDGVEAGDYNKGMALCYKTLAQEAVFRGVEPDADCINLVYEHTISSKTDHNYMTIKAILDEMGIRINCRFICATTIDDIHSFLRAPYSMMARSDTLGEELRGIFENMYGCKFLDRNLPRGFGETARWVETLGELYGKKEEATAIIQKQRQAYLGQIEAIKPLFQGKRVIVFLNSVNHEWLFELAEDLELDVVKTIILGKKNDDNPGWNRRFSAVWEFDRNNLEHAIEELAPDMLLLSDVSALSKAPATLCVINILRDLSCGFFAGIDCATGWAKLLDNVIEGRWERDKSIFEKYYS